MKTKQLFDSLDESERQKLADDLIRNNVTACQSSLVDMLIKNETEGFGIDDIENLYAPSEENPDESEPQEIFEWWLISDWFADKLRAIDEPILSNDYGTWWGRTCTGQSISCDYNIQLLACETYAEHMNRVSKVKVVGL